MNCDQVTRFRPAKMMWWSWNVTPRRLFARFPCVLICMSDVRTLPGRLVVKAGLENHPLTVCKHGMEENHFYVENQKPAEGRTRMQ
jgi:hypothetical protein